MKQNSGVKVKDIKGQEIKLGDLLLNLRSPRDPFDAWAYLICVPGDKKGELLIRDFNAWNRGWTPEETLIIGQYTDPLWAHILESENETIEKIKESIDQALLNQEIEPDLKYFEY